MPTTDVASNEPGVATTVAVAVSGPTRPESLHQYLPSASPASDVPISVLGATSVEWQQLLAASMQRAPHNVTAQARLRAANVEEMAASSTDPEVRRLLGVEGEQGKFLGLDNDWAKRAIAANGNYGEIFETNLGESTPIKLARGLNALWSQGGLQYAPPFR